MRNRPPTWLSTSLTVCFACLPACCRDAGSEDKAPVRQKEAPTVTRRVAGELTGYRAVKQGRNMQKKLKAIEKDRNEALSTILEEE